MVNHGLLKSDLSETPPNRSPVGKCRIIPSPFQLSSLLTQSLQTLQWHFPLCNFPAAAPTAQDPGSEEVLDPTTTAPFMLCPSLPWLLLTTRSQLSNIQERRKIPWHYWRAGVRGRIPLWVLCAFTPPAPAHCPQPRQLLLCWRQWWSTLWNQRIHNHGIS